MCASCISILLILVFHALRMGTDGLPVNRREHGIHQDIIAGADFLSVLMESPALRQAYRELSTTELPQISRLSRSTSSIDDYTFTKLPHNVFDGSTEVKHSSGTPKFNISTDSLIISSNTLPIESESLTSKVPRKIEPYIIEVTTSKEEHHMFIEDHPSIISDTSKSEFSAEEAEPITFPDYLQEYTAKVEPVRNTNNDITQSQSVIYHNNPVQANHGRSVSYSTVIQSLPKGTNLDWNDDHQSQQRGERRERHYDIKGSLNENKFEGSDSKYNKKLSNNWEKPEPLTTSTEKNWEPAEEDHATREKLHVTPSTSALNNLRFPVIYGKPEDNYEVDEAVSVMSSGRVHGIQPPVKNDNQKVGYVVEGRNYRKYRVEERTSDGFIVGEYGVVSHDDGSLRGVRYTADGTINPRLIHDALMKFLSL